MPFPPRLRGRLARLGRAVAGAALVLGVAAPAATAAGGAGERAGTAGTGSAVVGERRVAVVMVNFRDGALEDPDRLERALAERYFGKDGSLDAYYRAVSRGAVRFAPAGSAPVAGPVDLPMRGKGCDNGRMAGLARAALAERGLTAHDYDHLSIVFPARVADCAWSGLATVGGGTSWLPDDLSRTALVHEFGHNLGLGHHMTADCPDGALRACRTTGDTSGTTPMGGGGAAAGLAAPEMRHAGWLGGERPVGAAGRRTYALRPLHGGGSGGRRALEVQLGGGDSLVLELRAPAAGLDRAVGGVFAYRVRNGAYGRSVLVDNGSGGALRAGDTLASGAVRVTVVRAGGTAARVRVERHTGSGVPAPGSGPGGEGAGAGERGRSLAHTGGGSGSGAPLPAVAAALLATGAGAVFYATRQHGARRR